MKKQLSDEKHLLFLKRTQAQFSEPTWRLLTITPISENLTFEGILDRNMTYLHVGKPTNIK